MEVDTMIQWYDDIDIMAMQTLEEGWVIVDWQETAQKKYGNAWRCGQYTKILDNKLSK